MARPTHPHKDVEALVDEALRNGWRFVETGSNSWGKLLCPYAGREGCTVIIWSTPKNPGNFAKRLSRMVAKCAHQEN